MLTRAELIEFVDHVIKLAPESVESDSELALLFLHVHHQAIERWDDVIFAFAEESGVHFALCLDSGLLGHLSRVNILIFTVHLLLLLVIIVVHLHDAVVVDTQLFSGTLWQSQGLDHLLKMILEFGSGTTRFSELLLKFLAVISIWFRKTGSTLETKVITYSVMGS